MSKARKVLGGAAAVLSASALAAVMGIATATAADRDGVCDAGVSGQARTGEFCLYYNSYQAGSLFDSRYEDGNIKNLAGYTFLTRGVPGYGQYVKNNAASAWNRNVTKSVYVFYNSNFMGASDYVGTLQKKQLVNTYNQNASYLWTQ
ncbi:peptidase inhibitor family I36 protein [Streptomyces sp. NRRL F-5123]|uniref:peptidase inhibitor family I36 protein n=1 Tax=Streptomyces sp. NRRL F-5123 TaxID=1463856 RepID=UPI0007C57718|nr:peptidase inhibitor family I36 protein [Streptomyces sp. NRRL F-5123]